VKPFDDLAIGSPWEPGLLSLALYAFLVFLVVGGMLFYLLATFFLIFDVEALYILSWAVAAEPLGWEGWMQISFFIFVLLVSLFYLWKKGGLEWGPKSPRSPERPRI
jgi:hypothetical protein